MLLYFVKKKKIRYKMGNHCCTADKNVDIMAMPTNIKPQKAASAMTLKMATSCEDKVETKPSSTKELD